MQYKITLILLASACRASSTTGQKLSVCLSVCIWCRVLTSVMSERCSHQVNGEKINYVAVLPAAHRTPWAIRSPSITVHYKPD